MKRLVAAALLALGVASQARAQVSAPAAAPAQQPSGNMAPLDAVVATVGNVPITRTDVQERYFQWVAQLMVRHAPEPSTAEKRAALDTIVGQMIDEQVLLAKAKDYKIEIPDILVSPHADQQVKDARSHFSSEAEFQAELARSGMGTPDDYRRFLIDAVRTDTTIKLVYQKLGDDNKLTPVNVSDADIEAMYKMAMGGPNVPLRPTMIVFRQLIIAPAPSAKAKAEARTVAESLLAEIKRGEDFEHVAKRSSMDPATKNTGGLIEHIRRGEMVPELDRLVFGPSALKPGEVSPVVETATGFHIIRKDRATAIEVQAHDIVIRPAIDSADVVASRKLADSVANLIRSGVPFDSLTKKFHDFGGNEDAGLMPGIMFDSLPDSYKKGITSTKQNDVSVFEIPTTLGIPKIVIAQVVSFEVGGPYTLSDLRAFYRQKLGQEAAVRRYLDTLRKQTYVHVDMARVYSILDG